MQHLGIWGPVGPGITAELVAGGRSAGQESCMAWWVGQELLMFLRVLGRWFGNGSSQACAAIQFPMLE